MKLKWIFLIIMLLCSCDDNDKTQWLREKKIKEQEAINAQVELEKDAIELSFIDFQKGVLETQRKD